MVKNSLIEIGQMIYFGFQPSKLKSFLVTETYNSVDLFEENELSSDGFDSVVSDIASFRM